MIANEEDAKDVLGIHPSSDETLGKLIYEGYKRTATGIVKEFANISLVVTTLRESISASYNNWSAILYDSRDKFSCLSPQWQIVNILHTRYKTSLTKLAVGIHLPQGLSSL